MENEKLVVILDSVSRTITGIVVEETDTTVTLKNPVIVNAVPAQGGQMSLQLFPVFFREVLEDKNADVEFTYNKGAITMSDIDALEPQIVAQYNGIFREVTVVAPSEVIENSKVVDLFPAGERTDG